MQYGSVEGAGRTFLRHIPDFQPKEACFTRAKIYMGMFVGTMAVVLIALTHHHHTEGATPTHLTVNLDPLDEQSASFHANSESFVNEVEAWFEMIEMDGLPEDTYEGQGMSSSGVRCNDDLPQYSPSACETVFSYVRSLYSLELKGLALYLVRLLDGNKDSVDKVVGMTEGFGLVQTNEMSKELDDHPEWFLNGMESFGGGGGAGFQIFCRGIQLLTAGGGGGGGFTSSDGLNAFAKSAGGGGGVQITYKGKEYSIGGGAGGGDVTQDDPDWDHINSDKNADPAGFYDNLHQLLGQLESCPRDQVGLWFGGGGGGGVTIDGKTYTLGASYFYRQFGMVGNAHTKSKTDDMKWCDQLPVKARKYTDCPPVKVEEVDTKTDDSKKGKK